MIVSWHQARFAERPGTVHVECAHCGRSMWFPPSKAGLYKCCGTDCTKAKNAALRELRKRECDTCSKVFYPRQVQIDNGGGRFCSQKCNKPFHHASQAPDVWERRIDTMREKRARGEWTVLCGEDSPKWKGGAKASRLRRAESGKEIEGARRWRKNNPEKVREFCRRRRGRILGRLAPGTIDSIKRLQRERCAICRCRLPKGFHVDHIVPISKGGPHVARNIQLLCPSCNSAKSNRDPLAHMQSLGRLL